MGLSPFWKSGDGRLGAGRPVCVPYVRVILSKFSRDIQVFNSDIRVGSVSSVVSVFIMLKVSSRILDLTAERWIMHGSGSEKKRMLFSIIMSSLIGISGRRHLWTSVLPRKNEICLFLVFLFFDFNRLYPSVLLSLSE